MKKSKDNNYTFIFNNLQHKLKPYSNSIAQSTRHLKQMNRNDKNQWGQLLTLKIAYLYNTSNISNNAISVNDNIIENGNLSQLWQCVLKLVILCNQHQCQYDNKMMQDILKQLYIKEINEKDKDKDNRLENNQLIVKKFKEVNFDTSQYELLLYEDPWYVKIGRFFTFQ